MTEPRADVVELGARALASECYDDGCESDARFMEHSGEVVIVLDALASAGFRLIAPDGTVVIGPH